MQFPLKYECISSIGGVFPLRVSVRCWLMACVLGFMWAMRGAWQLSSVQRAQRVKIVNKLQRRNDFGKIHRFKFRKILKCAACTTKWNVWKIVVNFLVGFTEVAEGEGRWSRLVRSVGGKCNFNWQFSWRNEKGRKCVCVLIDKCG